MAMHKVPLNSMDKDPCETAEWLQSLEHALQSKGPSRVNYLLTVLGEDAHHRGVELPFTAVTPYINTIPVDKTPIYPGNASIERRIRSIIRWNAMMMVVRANKERPGIGGHISTYASIATLYEVGFNHFFRARTADFIGDQVYFQGHSSPGVYARAFMEGRLSESHLLNFRRELAPGGGLSSYPHPWLMPDFWNFATVSMGLGPIMGIYQARFMRYMENRGLLKPSDAKVWVFVGDGETDEPETLGAIDLASREKLDNLIFVVNCNLQRLDGPVRGNGKIIQELEGTFRGAGWNVLKVIWGADWDPLLASPAGSLLARRMGEVVDGEYQKYVVNSGGYFREHFFGKYPELAELVKHLSDEKLKKMRRGGHDPEKVYAAYKAATECKGRPTVILAKTIKGYGMGQAGEGLNMTHQQKKLNEDELREFRTRFGIPISDQDVADGRFYLPPENSPEVQYLHDRRKTLGGYMPARKMTAAGLQTPPMEEYKEFLEGSASRDVSTTMAFVRMLGKLLRDPKIGKNIVPIVPDESRTFGMDGLFRQCGIYSSVGQLYEPVDSESMLYYREAKDGQILEEGISEAGSMSSFIAAGSAYANLGVSMIPVFIFYSMFGFQRVGDLIWAANDMRCKGFLIGATSGRTTLNGEGLQHQDGQSLLMASAYPLVRAYDPAFAYEIAVIVMDGLKRMYQDQETAIYYMTVQNENYAMPPMPAGVEEGICRGIYKCSSRQAGEPAVQLLGSGAILREALRAQEILADKYQVSSNVWSVTSYSELARDATAADRWNMLHPQGEARTSFIQNAFKGEGGPFVAATDYVRAVANQVARWVPGGLRVLGADGFGRSDSRAALRRFFEIDAESIVLASLHELVQRGAIGADVAARAVAELGMDPEKANPLTA